MPRRGRGDRSVVARLRSTASPATVPASRAPDRTVRRRDARRYAAPIDQGGSCWSASFSAACSSRWWCGSRQPLSANADGEQITGFVRNQTTKDGKHVREPVPNVKIAFSTADGKSIGVVTTDDKGGYTQPVPGPGGYTARDRSISLPKGVALRQRRSSQVDGQRQPRRLADSQLLPRQETPRSTKGRWGISQTLANGIKFGLIIAICAVGLSLIYGTTGLSNFAHGEIVTLGAIVAWWMNQTRRSAPARRRAVGMSRPRGVGGAVLERGSVATAAPQGHQPHVDDDRVDRHRHRRPLHLPVLLRRPPAAPTASTPCRRRRRLRAVRLDPARPDSRSSSCW